MATNWEQIEKRAKESETALAYMREHPLTHEQAIEQSRRLKEKIRKWTDMEHEIELQVMPSGNVAIYRGNGFIPTEQLTEEEKEFIVECVHKELGWTRPAFEVDGSIGSPDYERGFKHGRDFQAELSAKSTDTDKVIEYLVHQKGYPISTNGEIPSYEETFEAVKNVIEPAKSKNGKTD